jgi:hypothetical protein
MASMEELGTMVSEGTSDGARATLATVDGFDMDEIVSSFRQASGATIAVGEALMMPLFLPIGLDPPQPLGAHTQMSQDVITSNSRKALKDYFSYSVKFRAWGTFTADIDTNNAAFASGQITTRICSDMIRLSFQLGVDPGEIQELTSLKATIKNLLLHFGFKFNVHYSTPKSDFDFVANGDGRSVISGKGKTATKVPDTELPNDASHQLCSFGFATFVARTASTPFLGTLLNLDFGHRGSHNPGSKASKFVVSLLTAPHGDMAQVVTFVHSCLRQERIRAQDAVNLWAAVMQACLAAVTADRKVSIVLSIKMIWFIRLVVEHGVCYVEITNGRRVDGRGFLNDLVRFLRYAETIGPMDTADKSAWEIAVEGILLDEDDESANGGAPAEDNESAGADAPNERRSKRPRDTSSTEESTPSSHDSSAVLSGPDVVELQDNKVSTRARTVPIDQNEAQRKDKYGVIARFSEIGESLDLLGTGRCGQVKKVAWGSEYAALKEFSFLATDDEDRYFFDVYEKELDIFLNLKELWGTHVPALLFHKPWVTLPLIGLQLGEPMKEDNISLWSKEDQEMVDETIAKVKEHGWEQTDLRGRNFVRLNGLGGKKYIAMIDFESLVPVDKKKRYKTVKQ